jgi:starvation-inducible outer membrane lipoprotein
MMKRLLTFCLLLGLTGCWTPSPSEMKPQDAKAIINSMQFVKHANGLCFGIVNTQRLSTSGRLTESISITQVDCEKAGL